MAKKRERLDLIYDILLTIRKEGNVVGPTKLLQASNLSSQMFKEYIHELLSKTFIEEIQVGKKKSMKKAYTLTIKGEEFIDKYKEMKKFIENFGL